MGTFFFKLHQNKLMGRVSPNFTINFNDSQEHFFKTGPEQSWEHKHSSFHHKCQWLVPTFFKSHAQTKWKMETHFIAPVISITLLGNCLQNLCLNKVGDRDESHSDLCHFQEHFWKVTCFATMRHLGASRLICNSKLCMICCIFFQNSCVCKQWAVLEPNPIAMTMRPWMGSKIRPTWILLTIRRTIRVPKKRWRAKICLRFSKERNGLFFSFLLSSLEPHNLVSHLK